MTGPLAVLMIYAVFFIFLNASLSNMPRVSGVSGQWIEMKSLYALIKLVDLDLLHAGLLRLLCASHMDRI